MNISNCYEAALKLFELSEELTDLFDQKEKEKEPRNNEILDSKIDNVESDFLDLKHSLTEIPYVKSAR